MPVQETTGRATYNGVAFEIYSSQISGDPVYDDAERTVIGVKWVLSFHAYVVAEAGETTDVSLTTLRRRLTSPAKPLTYTSKGFGNLKINQGEVWDMRWGPKPKLMSFVPVGDSRAAIVDWKVETIIPECPGAKYRFGIAAINFQVSMTIDSDGYMMLSHSGYIEIPMTRQNSESRRLNDHVRRYMEDSTPPSILGFQRTNQKTVESLDKRRLDFEFTDVQLPTPLFQYTTKADLTQTLKTGLRQRGFVIFDGNISGSITVPANTNKQITYTLFMSLLHHRLISNFTPGPPVAAGPTGVFVLDQLIQAVQALAGGGNAPGLRAFVMVTEFSVKDNITGRNTDYSADYRIFLTGRPHQVGDVFLKNGFWYPLPNTDWDLWKVSMDETANRPRGSRNYRDNGENDAIIDLCLNENRGPRTQTQTPTLDNLPDLVPIRPQNPKVSAFMPRDRVNPRDAAKPAPENSWIHYDCGLSYREDEAGRMVRHKPMGGRVKELHDQNRDATGSSIILQRNTSGHVASATNSVKDNIHEVRSPSPKIYLYGQAIRLGHKIPLPRLISVGGVTAKLNKTVEYRETVLSQYAGLPIFGTVWILEYLLDSPPEGQLPTTANPQLHIG